MMRSHKIIALVAFLLLATACAEHKVKAPTVPPAQTAPSVSAPEVQEEFYREVGTASWYGGEYHGKKTANGEVFDMYGISAAHRILPFGTMIRVTNLDNAKSINVRINDRGPLIKSRILELSYGGAKELGFVERGTARVVLETADVVRGPAQYTVLAAVYTEEENAQTLKYRLSRKFETVTIAQLETNITTFYTVRVGAYATRERAEQIISRLRLEGLEPMVIRKD